MYCMLPCLAAYSPCSVGHRRWRQRGPPPNQRCFWRECLRDSYFHYSSFLLALRLVFFTAKDEDGLSCRHLLLPVCMSVLSRAGCLLHPVLKQQNINSVWRSCYYSLRVSDSSQSTLRITLMMMMMVIMINTKQHYKLTLNYFVIFS